VHARDHERTIQRWIDGEADPADAARADALAGECDACDRLARELRAVGSLCREASAPSAPRPDLATRTLDAIRRGEPARIVRESVLLVLRRTAAVAAALLVVTTFLSVQRASGPAIRSGALAAATSEAEVVREVVTRHVIFHEIGGDAAAPAAEGN